MLILDFIKHQFSKPINLIMKKQGKIRYIEVRVSGMPYQQVIEILILLPLKTSK